MSSNDNANYRNYLLSLAGKHAAAPSSPAASRQQDHQKEQQLRRHQQQIQLAMANCQLDADRPPANNASHHRQQQQSPTVSHHHHHHHHTSNHLQRHTQLQQDLHGPIENSPKLAGQAAMPTTTTAANGGAGKPSGWRPSELTRQLAQMVKSRTGGNSVSSSSSSSKTKGGGGGGGEARQPTGSAQVPPARRAELDDAEDEQQYRRSLQQHLVRSSQQHQHQPPPPTPHMAARNQPAATYGSQQANDPQQQQQQQHVNFGRPAGARFQEPDREQEPAELEGPEKRKKKYLTAKYGQQQMSLIKKRLKVETWLYEQLQALAKGSKCESELDEIDIDLDELLDMEDDQTRRAWLRKTLGPFEADVARERIDEFIGQVLEQSKLL